KGNSELNLFAMPRTARPSYSMKYHQSQNRGAKTFPSRVYAHHSVYRVKKVLGSHPIPAFPDLPFISSINAAMYTCVIIRKVFLGL
ncbi:hypothetical protein PIB30_062365, partial [Stylosanthes scabra]|nr:hypothetical protein [Stylosanthes scabra]